MLELYKVMSKEVTWGDRSKNQYYSRVIRMFCGISKTFPLAE